MKSGKELALRIFKMFQIGNCVAIFVAHYSNGNAKNNINHSCMFLLQYITINTSNLVKVLFSIASNGP